MRESEANVDVTDSAVTTGCMGGTGVDARCMGDIGVNAGVVVDIGVNAGVVVDIGSKSEWPDPLPSSSIFSDLGISKCVSSHLEAA